MQRSSLIVAALAVSGCGGANRTPKATEWYEGGTLHRKTAEAWMNASSDDRLATSADFAAKVLKTSSMAELRVKAADLSACITKAAPASLSTPAAELAAACAILLGAK